MIKKKKKKRNRISGRISVNQVGSLLLSLWGNAERKQNGGCVFSFL